MTTRVRFAPSPTGYLHIGGARIALFNYLFAKSTGGKFLLRIEDTDRARSTYAAVDAIFAGLKWLGLDWDEEVVYQFARAERHREIARKLVELGKAYYCYAHSEESKNAKNIDYSNFKHFVSPWRDKSAPDELDGVKGAVRLKVNNSGTTKIEDKVQGIIEVSNSELDDMVLLRSDGTPTYMLAVVVDDHDMDITHVIRGDDHLTNSFRQVQIYNALEWRIPIFAHVPLNHAEDGSKLSKRHGAAPVGAYEEMGILPEALNNYLMRLGWSHGNDEIISMEEAVSWFKLEDLNRAPSKLDTAKLMHINGCYIRKTDNDVLLKKITPILMEKHDIQKDAKELEYVTRGINGLKERAEDLNKLVEIADVYFTKAPFDIDAENQKYFSPENIEILTNYVSLLLNVSLWEEKHLLNETREFLKTYNKKLAEFSQILRLKLCGRTISPSVFEMFTAFGRDESIRRITL